MTCHIWLSKFWHVIIKKKKKFTLILAANDHHQEIHHITNKLYCLSALSSNNFNLATSATALGFCKKFEGNKSKRWKNPHHKLRLKQWEKGNLRGTSFAPWKSRMCYSNLSHWINNSQGLRGTSFAPWKSRMCYSNLSHWINNSQGCQCLRISPFLYTIITSKECVVKTT